MSQDSKNAIPIVFLIGGAISTVFSGILGTIGLADRQQLQNLLSAPVLKGEEDIENLKQLIQASPTRKVYTRVQGLLTTDTPIKVTANKKSMQSVLYGKKVKTKSTIPTQSQNGVDPGSYSHLIKQTGSRLILLKDQGEKESPSTVAVDGSAFFEFISPGMVAILTTDERKPWSIHSRLVTTHWVLPLKTKVRGAYDATVDETGDIRLWRPTRQIFGVKYFFTTRPEQAIIDELTTSSYTCTTLSAGIAALAVGFFASAFLTYDPK